MKAVTLVEGRLPDRVMGAAWGPQRDQIVAGIFHALFVVAFSPLGRLVSVDYVPGHILQAVPERCAGLAGQACRLVDDCRALAAISQNDP